MPPDLRLERIRCRTCEAATQHTVGGEPPRLTWLCVTCGTMERGGTARLAVAGGTGTYRNARGQIIARDLGQEHADVVFLLIP